MKIDISVFFKKSVEKNKFSLNRKRILDILREDQYMFLLYLYYV